MFLIDYIRRIGAFQWMCILAYAIFTAVNTQTNLAILFVAPSVDFHCDDAAESFRNLSDQEQQKLMTVFGRCYRPDLNLSDYTSDQLLRLNLTDVSLGITNRSCDTGFIYDHQYYDYTVTEQYNLVCERKWLISMSKSTFLLGYFFGAVGSGAISDRFGRKKAAILFLGLASAFNFLSAFSPNVEVFLLARCLVGACGIAYYTTGLILTTELVRKDERKIPRTALSLSISILTLAFVGISYRLRDHRFLQSYIGASLAVSTIILWFVFPESPRWLTAKDRHGEAKAVVERIAKFNHWPMSDLEHLLARQVKSDRLERQANITDLFRTPIMRKRTLILCAIWCTHVLTFYALLYNLGSFYPDLRVSMMISQAIEIPFLFVPMLLIDIVGRQILSFAFLSVAGIFCLSMIPLMGQGGSVALLALATIGKISAGGQFFIAYVYTQELMPTVVRSQGLGMASTASRIGGMIAPLIILLDDFWPATSVLILGVCALIGASLTLLLPDTTHVELTQSIADGESFKAEHGYKFDYPVRRRLTLHQDQDHDEVETVNLEVTQDLEMGEKS